MAATTTAAVQKQVTDLVAVVAAFQAKVTSLEARATALEGQNALLQLSLDAIQKTLAESYA